MISVIKSFGELQHIVQPRHGNVLTFHFAQLHILLIWVQPLGFANLFSQSGFDNRVIAIYIYIYTHNVHHCHNHLIIGFLLVGSVRSHGSLRSHGFHGSLFSQETHETHET